MNPAFDQLLAQALLARRENRAADAKRDLLEAVHMAREGNQPLELAKALTRLGQIERDMDQVDAALRLYEEAVNIYRKQADRQRLAHTVRHVGDIHREAGRLQLAEPCYDEALQLYRGQPQTDPLDLANTLRGFALLKSNTGQTEAARLFWTEARDLYATVKVEAGVQESTRRLALLAQQSRPN